MAVDTLAANMRHIVLHESKPQPRSLPEHAVTKGFEATAYPVLVSQLTSEDVIIRRKAVLAARELLVQDVKHVQCIRAGITPPLLQALQDPEPQHRGAAAGTLQLLVCRELGVRDFLHHDGLFRLLPLLTDADTQVRDAGYAALEAGCAFQCCRGAMALEGSVLPLLLDRAMAETPARAVVALRLLNSCLQMRQGDHALSQLQGKHGCTAALSSLLGRVQEAALWRQAAALLAVLAATDDGIKEEAVAAGCVPKLLAVLDPVSITTPGRIPLCTAATCALMMITLIKQGKRAVADDQGVQVLAEAVRKVEDEGLSVALLQVVANIAELPLCRNGLLAENMARVLEGIATEAASPRTRAAAKRALRGALFEHWPQ